MRAAIVEPVGGHGGMDYYDFGLCEALSKAGIEATLYTCDETSWRSRAFGVEIPYRGVFGAAPAWLRGLRHLRGTVRALVGARLKGARISHFHFFHVGPLELFGVLLARSLGMRVVVTAHDVQPFVERLSVPWMAARAYRMAARVIAQGRTAEKELGALLDVPASRIDVVPHGSYLPFVGEAPARGAARARLGLPEEARVLLFFGQIKAVKGLDLLIRAMPRVLREHPDTVLLVAGKAWKDDLRRYRAQIEALGIAESCVLHTRYIPDEDVAAYYAAADVVVLPYRRIYQSGVLLMAMSHGRPVVASDLPGMTEVVSDGVTGYLFAAGNAQALAARLAGVLGEDGELRRTAQRALRYVEEHHDWERIGAMTAACYRSALKG
ncbi:glycosyltransferase [Rubrobacter tropicus]|uniref:Glycosyltransferase n=1 Tax=Rubrobacter tropicus TaxID=2653851 RepID=A0A6G8Q9Q2_9ACTN|nr:glycosyltransferase family 4 protein [Rubrobacter tropicus]QIN83158.1 glycosyltransferase [Rubrobacter tropicus]